MWCFTNWECLHNSPTNACSYVFIIIKYGVMEPPFMKQFFLGVCICIGSKTIGSFVGKCNAN